MTVKEDAWWLGLELTEEQITEIERLDGAFAAAGCPGFAYHLLDLLSRWSAEEVLRRFPVDSK